MVFVTDPDSLDRFQVAVDPIAETLSIRGLDTERHAVDSTGDSAGTTTFTDAGANFTGDGVAINDILTIISDPADNGGIIGHYIVTSSITATNFVVDRTIPSSTGADLTYKINAPEATGAVGAAVADGVAMQTLYSFLKEEWRTLAAGLGNAEDLIQYTYPIESITSEQFEIGGTTHSNWDFADQTTKDLIRTGGWAKQDSSGNVIQDYAGIITLGSMDSDAQVYYQQHAITADPTDFVLTGAVNQAINIFDELTGPDAGVGFAITTSNTITRNDGGNWFVDGYRVGGSITIRAAEDAGNIGTFILTTVDNSTDGTVVVSGTPLTNNAADTTMIAAVNKRSFLKLFVRKKARSYAGSEIADIGVSSLVTIVNRFPLTHATDPAITLVDGAMAGDGTNNVYQAVETVDSAKADGATSVEASDGTFTLTSATSLFVTGPLISGDTVTLTSGSDQAVYEIKTVTSETVLTCFTEPTVTFTGGEGTLTFTTRTGVRDTGLANATLANIDTATGNLTSVGATFTTDDGLGSRIVLAGDMVIVSTGTGVVLGVYKVVSITSATVLVLNTEDQIFSGETNQTYRIMRPGMYLQYLSTTSTGFTQADISFADANPDTITRGTGSWITDGYEIGTAITIAGSTSNDGTYIISSRTATIITLITSETLIVEGTGASITVSGESGFVKTLNAVDYPFNWRLFGNGATLAQAFQFIQREMRRTTDIDEGDTVKRGDVNDLLMSFTSPNGVGLNMFVDDLAGSVLNNATKNDLTDTTRAFAFIAGVTITLNSNITTDANAKVVVFFSDADGTPANGDEFGSNGAIIVQDDVPVDMTDITPLTSPLSFNFDYDNNAQGGRTPGTDAAVTIVCMGTDLAQYVQVTGTIARQSDNSFALVSSLERNYQNP